MTDEREINLVVQPIRDDDPGYLRRIMEYTGVVKRLENAGDDIMELAGAIEDFVDVLLKYVDTKDDSDPREVLLDLSKNELESLGDLVFAETDASEALGEGSGDS